MRNILIGSLILLGVGYLVSSQTNVFTSNSELQVESESFTATNEVGFEEVAGLYAGMDLKKNY